MTNTMIASNAAEKKLMGGRPTARLAILSSPLLADLIAPLLNASMPQKEGE